MSDDRSELVFVYGTLRIGASNHWRMEGAESHGMAGVRGRLYTIDWYPGLVLDPEGDAVAGEVYRVGPRQLADLDAFEGAEFERVRAVARMEDGEAVDVWLYTFSGDVEGRAPRRPADWLLAEE